MTFEERIKHIVALVADYIETYGKMKGRLGSAGGPCCVVGAILVMEPDSSIRSHVYRAIRNKIPDTIKWGIPHWSDLTSEQEVIVTLREIANS